MTNASRYHYLITIILEGANIDGEKSARRCHCFAIRLFGRLLRQLYYLMLPLCKELS